MEFKLANLTVSVVINTYNRIESLRNAISGVRGIQYAEFELIVVNGPSDDGTSQYLSGEPNIKYVQCAEANLAKSRNMGIQCAAGDIIAFLDDDAVPDPLWLTELTKTYTSERIGAVGGYTIDNTGSRYQVRKTICDRYGNAISVSNFFDERPLNVPYSPFYPSLLGTNCSFRATALREIGGFDHAYAYFLDETDVCLRIVDSGREVHYAPNALVYHQYAASHLRDVRRVPKSLYATVLSKSYFIGRHGWRGGGAEQARQRDEYESNLRGSIKGLFDQRVISEQHLVSLQRDISKGIADGAELAGVRGSTLSGDISTASSVSPIEPVVRDGKCRIAFICQSYDFGDEGGIARWTSLAAAGLASRGHQVHVLAKSEANQSVRYEQGVWVHRLNIGDDGVVDMSLTQKVPKSIIAWSLAAKKRIELLIQQGLDLVSFPIWDVEGTTLGTEIDVAVVMSLHTSYALAKPFKKEWSARPLYEHFFVDRVIQREKQLLKSVPTLLANSSAIIRDLEQNYQVSISDRSILAYHGTHDPFLSRPARLRFRERRGSSFQIAFVGRFEHRKGFDIAASAILKVLGEIRDISIVFVGGALDEDALEVLASVGAEQLVNDRRVRFLGKVDRHHLDDIYCESDVVLVPSRYESFGLVAIEAMAAAAVVIGCKVGGLQEVIDHKISGLLVANDANVDIGFVDNILDLYRDRKRLNMMSEKARAVYSERFSLDVMLDAIESAYLSSIRKRG